MGQDTLGSDHPLEQVLKKAAENASGQQVSFGSLLDLFGDRSFGPIFTILGLMVVLPPMGAIPGIPAAIGVVILLFSTQIIFGRQHIWLPSWIENLSIEKSKIEVAHKKSEGVLAFIDKIVTDRFEWATRGAARYIAAIIVSLLAILIIPLELVPFAVAIPGIAISAIGLAMIARDGLLMLFALGLSVAAFSVVVWQSPLSGWLGLG